MALIYVNKLFHSLRYKNKKFNAAKTCYVANFYGYGRELSLNTAYIWDDKSVLESPVLSGDL